MRVLVTGATGFLAQHLIPALQVRGHEVRGLVLPSGNAGWLNFRGVEVSIGDVRDPSSLMPAMRGVDAVFHLAAAIGVRRPMREYVSVNVTGTGNVCRAALEAGVSRLVHVSSTSVYKQGLSTAVAEDAPLSPLPDPYPLTKAVGDCLVQNFIREYKLPACIVRTCTVFGPGDDLNFGRIADRLLANRGIIIGSGRNSVPFVYVGDLVQGLLLTLEHPRAEGQVYNIADEKPQSQEDLLGIIAEEIGARPPHRHVPYSMLYGTAYVAEGIARMMRSQHPLVTRFGVALYGADNRFGIDKARSQLGYEPKMPLREGIRLTAAWYKSARTATAVTAPLGATR